jgi:hypothetical protein
MIACKIYSSPFSGERFFEFDALQPQGEKYTFEGAAPKRYFFDSKDQKIESIPKEGLDGFMKVYEIPNKYTTDQNSVYIYTPEGEVALIDKNSPGISEKC